MHSCLIYVSSRAAQQEHTTMTRSVFVVAADITLVVVPIRMNICTNSRSLPTMSPSYSSTLDRSLRLQSNIVSSRVSFRVDPSFSIQAQVTNKTTNASPLPPTVKPPPFYHRPFLPLKFRTTSTNSSVKLPTNMVSSSPIYPPSITKLVVDLVIDWLEWPTQHG